MASTTKPLKDPSVAPLCRGCQRSIVDKFYLHTDDQAWHGACLRCQVCDSLLENTSSCFKRNGLIYCEEDYFRLFRQQRQCAQCGGEIGRAEMVMRALHCVFHVPCFTCAICSRPLRAGEYFLLDDNKLFCQLELAKSSLDTIFSGIHSHYRHPVSSGAAAAAARPDLQLDRPSVADVGPIATESRCGVARRPQDFVVMEMSKQKRLRTSFKHHQVRVMRTYFSLNHNPDTKDLKTLSEKTGLSKRVLQVWFQNARAKFRRGGPHKSDTNSQTNEDPLDSTLSYSDDGSSSSHQEVSRDNDTDDDELEPIKSD